jgi:GDPmannose 4,6-dehydratase
MVRIIEYGTPEDFVVATGETNMLEAFVAATFACLKLDWHEHAVRNDAFLRPSDIAYSSGDPGKAERLLGWKARKKMRDVVHLLVEAEQRRRRQA